MNHLLAQWRQAAKTPAGSWWENQPQEDVADEWRRCYDGTYGIVHYNDEYEMWGKKWPIYHGPGTSSYMAHVGIGYYDNLRTLLEVEEVMRGFGMTPPPRRKLLTAQGIEV